MAEVTTPDGKPLSSSRMCTCATHCPNSTYHERACCDEVWCTCRCHEREYNDRALDASVRASK
jgi:hypothetical protein